MKVVIREARIVDTEKIRALLIATGIEIFGKEPVNRDDYEGFRQFYRERKGIFYVAEQHGIIVGTIAVRQEKHSCVRLRRFCVAKNYRNRGIGEQLYAKVLSYCKKKGYKRIILCTYFKMEDAIRFYLRQGFREYKRKKEELYFDKVL